MLTIGKMLDPIISLSVVKHTLIHKTKLETQSLESAFYPCGSVVGICGEDQQRLVLVVHCHSAHSSDGAVVLRPLKLWRVETLPLNANGDGGGGKLITVHLLSSL